MDMNSHSFSHSHSRSSEHTDAVYSSTTLNNTRYYSVHRPRAQNMSHHHHQQPPSAPNQQQNSLQGSPWGTGPPLVSPPMLQEVYILDCRSCDTFLTNRGMKAVLLLQPDVPLYSSDALPVNCSANPGPLEYAPPQIPDSFYAPSLSCPSGIPVPLPRTCECLTQTLCCHGCGNGVGYMVVIPCHRCCSSVSPTNRHTNRHRFVFFNKEIRASERHYIPHEPGVIATSPHLVSTIAPTSSGSSISPSRDTYMLPPLSTSSSAYAMPPLPTPPPESTMSADYTTSDSYTPPMPRQSSQPPPFQFVVFKPERGKLRAGDVVYWHNLSRNGEIPAVIEDERARHSRTSSVIPFAGR